MTYIPLNNITKPGIAVDLAANSSIYVMPTITIASTGSTAIEAGLNDFLTIGGTVKGTTGIWEISDNGYVNVQSTGKVLGSDVAVMFNAPTGSQAENHGLIEGGKIGVQFGSSHEAT